MLFTINRISNFYFIIFAVIIKRKTIIEFLNIKQKKYLMKNLLMICISLLLVNTLSAQTFKYIGADKCKICHNKSATGDQYVKWLKDPHAQA